MAVLAFFGKRKMDEREYQLLYKVGCFTLFMVYAAMFFIYFLLPSMNWLLALACVFFFFHGLCGLVIFARE